MLTSLSGAAACARSFTERERDAFEASMVRGEGKDRKVDLKSPTSSWIGAWQTSQKIDHQGAG